jgi:hypothetical protein
VKVNAYSLATGFRDGAPTPRAWRISTTDGVFWLVEDGKVARVVRLPLPMNVERRASLHAGEPWSALEALAETAETEAAGAWVRGGRSAAPELGAKSISDGQR